MVGVLGVVYDAASEKVYGLQHAFVGEAQPEAVEICGAADGTDYKVSVRVFGI